MIEIEAETEEFDFVGSSLCLDFTNTVSNYGNVHMGGKLAGYADLVRWGRAAGVLSPEQTPRLLEEATRHPEETSNVHRRALALRDAVHWIFAAIAGGGRPESSGL